MQIKNSNTIGFGNAVVLKSKNAKDLNNISGMELGKNKATSRLNFSNLGAEASPDGYFRGIITNGPEAIAIQGIENLYSVKDISDKNLIGKLAEIHSNLLFTIKNYAKEVEIPTNLPKKELIAYLKDVLKKAK